MLDDSNVHCHDYVAELTADGQVSGKVDTDNPNNQVYNDLGEGCYLLVRQWKFLIVLLHHCLS